MRSVDNRGKNDHMSDLFVNEISNKQQDLSVIFSVIIDIFFASTETKN